MGYPHVKYSNDILIYSQAPKGEKPRTAWGEAIRGLGENCEDWALRSSLKLSVARPL